MAETPEQRLLKADLERAQRELTENTDKIESVLESLKELRCEMEPFTQDGGAMNLEMAKLTTRSIFTYQVRLTTLRKMEQLLSQEVRRLKRKATGMACNNPRFAVSRLPIEAFGVLVYEY
jgi:chromosome segregation ATPase